MWRGQDGVWLTHDQLERRASGRRHWNSWRQFLATVRRIEVAKLRLQGWKPSHIACRLYVSDSTIRRDMHALIREGMEAPRRCPTCQRPYDPALPQGNEG